MSDTGQKSVVGTLNLMDEFTVLTADTRNGPDPKVQAAAAAMLARVQNDPARYNEMVDYLAERIKDDKTARPSAGYGTRHKDYGPS